MGCDSPQLQNALPELSFQLMTDILPQDLGTYQGFAYVRVQWAGDFAG